MRVPLREYQDRGIGMLRAAFRRSPILVMPTGAGKTRVAAAVIVGAVAKGNRVGFFAHTREIVFQARDSFAGFGLDVGILMASDTCNPDAPVQVGTIQTLARRTRPPADVVIVDECHRARSRTYMQAMEDYREGGATIIGLTATPFRMDGKGLGGAGFGEICEAATPRELIDAGFLLEPRTFVGREAPDLKGVRTTAGDFAKGELGNRMMRPGIVRDIVGTWQRLAEDRPTVLFAANVEHSKHMRDEFRKAGVAAEHLDAKTPKDERNDILAGMKDGLTTLVTNYGILGEGWDLPVAGVCILARPTKSLGLYRQMVGRVLRPFEGKARPLVLDHAGNYDRHGLVTDPLEFSLDDKVKKGDGEAPTKTCKECYAIIPISATECPECGAECASEGEELPDEVDAVMVEVTAAVQRRTPLTSRERQFLELLRSTRSRGWKDGAAKIRYKNTFGYWPNRAVILRAEKELEWEYERLKQHLESRRSKPTSSEPVARDPTAESGEHQQELPGLSTGTE